MFDDVPACCCGLVAIIGHVQNRCAQSIQHQKRCNVQTDALRSLKNNACASFELDMLSEQLFAVLQIFCARDCEQMTTTCSNQHEMKHGAWRWKAWHR
jgi:hypothetical protein